MMCAILYVAMVVLWIHIFFGRLNVYARKYVCMYGQYTSEMRTALYEVEPPPSVYHPKIQDQIRGMFDIEAFHTVQLHDIIIYYRQVLSGAIVGQKMEMYDAVRILRAK